MEPVGAAGGRAALAAAPSRAAVLFRGFMTGAGPRAEAAPMPPAAAGGYLTLAEFQKGLTDRGVSGDVLPAALVADLIGAGELLTVRDFQVWETACPNMFGLVYRTMRGGAVPAQDWALVVDELAAAQERLPCVGFSLCVDVGGAKHNVPLSIPKHALDAADRRGVLARLQREVNAALAATLRLRDDLQVYCAAAQAWRPLASAGDVGTDAQLYCTAAEGGGSPEAALARPSSCTMALQQRLHELDHMALQVSGLAEKATPAPTPPPLEWATPSPAPALPRTNSVPAAAATPATPCEGKPVWEGLGPCSPGPPRAAEPPAAQATPRAARAPCASPAPLHPQDARITTPPPILSCFVRLGHPPAYRYRRATMYVDGDLLYAHHRVFPIPAVTQLAAYRDPDSQFSDPKAPSDWTLTVLTVNAPPGSLPLGLGGLSSVVLAAPTAGLRRWQAFLAALLPHCSTAPQGHPLPHPLQPLAAGHEATPHTPLR